MEVYFLAVVFGLPAVILAIALLAAHLYKEGYSELLDWKPTRSPQREAELEIGELDQMLAAQNRYRLERGAPIRSLDEVSGQTWADFNVYGEMLSPPDGTS
jgi:hypothetical protein